MCNHSLACLKSEVNGISLRWQPETNECVSATDSVKMRVRILTSCKNRVKKLYKTRRRNKESKRRRDKEIKFFRSAYCLVQFSYSLFTLLFPFEAEVLCQTLPFRLQPLSLIPPAEQSVDSRQHRWAYPYLLKQAPLPHGLSQHTE